MNITILRTVVVLGLFSLLIFSGCNQEEFGEIAESEANVPLPPSTLVNDHLDNAANVMSLMTRDVEVRTFIKAEAMLQFDGDYDVLFSRVKDHKFSDGQTFQSKFATAYAELNELTNAEGLEQVKALSAALPLLNISVPVNIDSWDAEADAIPVTFAPESEDEGNFTHLKAYNEDGSTQFIGISSDPDFPVMVVGLNERCHENGQVKKDFIPKANKEPRTKSFSSTQNIELWQVNVPNLSKWETWAYGKPEFKMTVGGGQASGSSSGSQYLLKSWFLPGKRSDYNNPGSWHVINDEIWPNWQDDIPGRYINVNVGEEDGGLPVDVEIKLFKIKVKKSWWPSWLDLNLGTIKLSQIGKNHKDLGSTGIDRAAFACWTDFYLGSSSDKTFRFYLNCP